MFYPLKYVIIQNYICVCVCVYVCVKTSACVHACVQAVTNILQHTDKLLLQLDHNIHNDGKLLTSYICMYTISMSQLVERRVILIWLLSNTYVTHTRRHRHTHAHTRMHARTHVHTHVTDSKCGYITLIHNDMSCYSWYSSPIPHDGHVIHYGRRGYQSFCGSCHTSNNKSSR